MPDATSHYGLPLTRQQMVRLVATGVSLWLAAALLLRVLGPIGALEGAFRVLFYLAVVPGTLPLVFLTKAVAGLRGDQVALGVSVVTAAALLLDGVVLACVPSLYTADPAREGAIGAAILWGGGIGLVLGFAFNRAAGS